MAAFPPALLHPTSLAICTPSQHRVLPGPALVHVAGAGSALPTQGDKGQGSPTVEGASEPQHRTAID